MTWILIFFIMLPNNTQAAVRVGFTSQETCVEAARDVQSKQPQGAQVTWSCVKQ